MSPLARLRLMKVLAMATSTQDGEALAAVRMAHQILEREGMSFSDLLPDTSRTTGPRLDDLGDIQVEMVIDREKVKTLKDQLAKTKAECEFWKQQARQAAEQLWDLGLTSESGKAAVEADAAAWEMQQKRASA